MRKFIISLFLISSCLFPASLFAQQVIKGSYSSLKEIHPHTHANHYNQIKSSKNELEVVFSGLFLIYKNFLSSQDMPACVFTPSCSEYGLQSVKKYGAPKGMINAFDRLQRCHGLNQDYSFDPKTGLMIDNVE